MLPKVAMLLSNPLAPDPRVYKEAKVLVEHKYDVTVFAWDREGVYPSHELRDGIHIQRIRVKSTYGKGVFQLPALLLFLLKVVSRILREFDIIHCHDLETLPIGLLVGKLTKRAVIFDAHEPNYYADARHFRSILVFMAKTAERFLAKRARCCIVTNLWQMNKYRRLGAQSVRMVANYPERNLIKEGRAEKSAGRFVVGRIGAMYYDMGLEEMISACDEVSKDLPNIKLVLVGHSTENYMSLIREMAAGVNVEVEIIPGYEYSEMTKYYGKVDVCVLPQKPTLWFRNITPTKFFEALCHGVPVITTDIGGIGEIVKRERCGLLIGEVTPQCIASAVRSFIYDPLIGREMGENGRRAVREKYNWDVSSKELLAAYQNL